MSRKKKAVVGVHEKLKDEQAPIFVRYKKPQADGVIMRWQSWPIKVADDP